MLQNFVDDNTQNLDLGAPPKKKGIRTTVKIDGVRVTCHGETSRVHEQHTDINGKISTINEDDEMIWWVWDGKILGFSDW